MYGDNTRPGEWLDFGNRYASSYGVVLFACFRLLDGSTATKWKTMTLYVRNHSTYIQHHDTSHRHAHVIGSVVALMEATARGSSNTTTEFSKWTPETDATRFQVSMRIGGTKPPALIHMGELMVEILVRSHLAVGPRRNYRYHEQVLKRMRLAFDSPQGNRVPNPERWVGARKLRCQGSAVRRNRGKREKVT
ncbi:hypothetical protein F5141DRAFT_228960 [Pisolithus sp. B1]|nr:hypothetical protein F5141DRAFT_228960 [Pisolithus sp. B1]